MTWLGFSACLCLSVYFRLYVCPLPSVYLSARRCVCLCVCVCVYAQPFCTTEAESQEMHTPGMTALHHACRQGDVEAAVNLISSRADPSIRDDHWSLPPR